MTLHGAIRRLRLKAGDIILLKRGTVPVEQLVRAGRDISMPVFSIPIIMVNNKNDIRRFSFEELEKIYLEAKNGRLQDSGTKNTLA